MISEVIEMHPNRLLNCMWYEDFSPAELADALELTPEALFEKISRENAFTEEEIRRIVGILGLTEEEERAFFYD